MRVVNDREQKAEVKETGAFSVIFYSFLVAIGVSTPILSPLPIIAAHARLGEPWPKIVSVVGALIAVCFLGEPFPAVVIGFVFGLVAADFVTRGKSVGRLFGATLTSSLGAALLMLFVKASQHQISVAEEWRNLVTTSVNAYEQVRAGWSMNMWLSPSDYEKFFLTQGPLLILGFFALSLWLCLGFIAHLGWWKPEHPYSAVKLRELRIPAWFSIAFILSLVIGNEARGAQFVLGILMVVQGSVLLSNWFSRKHFATWSRALIYSIGITFGLGVIAGLGVVAPIFFKKIKQEA